MSLTVDYVVFPTEFLAYMEVLDDFFLIFNADLCLYKVHHKQIFIFKKYCFKRPSLKDFYKAE